jgi:cation diffusion facilitator family transporter
VSTEGHGTKAILAAFAANLGIAVAKFVGFVFTGSGSMLAEGVHSLADTGNQGLLLFGGKRSQREATDEHPFGYGRERYFYAFVVAIVLFTLGAGFAIYDGISKWRHPHELEGLWWAVAILGVAVVLESFSFRTALRESRSQREPGQSLVQFIHRAKAPEIPVVLLEDFAALCGLCIALLAVILSHATGNPRWDALGTILIGVLLGLVAAVLAVEMKSLLIGESASGTQQDAIRAALVADDAVLRLIHVRTEHLGPEELLVGAKLEFRHDLTLPEVADAIDRVEVLVRADVPAARVLYIEPDISRDQPTAAPVAD